MPSTTPASQVPQIACSLPVMTSNPRSSRITSTIDRFGEWSSADRCSRRLHRPGHRRRDGRGRRRKSSNLQAFPPPTCCSILHDVDQGLSGRSSRRLLREGMREGLLRGTPAACRPRPYDDFVAVDRRHVGESHRPRRSSAVVEFPRNRRVFGGFDDRDDWSGSDPPLQRCNVRPGCSSNRFGKPIAGPQTPSGRRRRCGRDSPKVAGQVGGGRRPSTRGPAKERNPFDCAAVNV
jgi:hypothetical protein